MESYARTGQSSPTMLRDCDNLPTGTLSRIFEHFRTCLRPSQLQPHRMNARHPLTIYARIVTYTVHFAVSTS